MAQNSNPRCPKHSPDDPEAGGIYETIRLLLRTGKREDQKTVYGYLKLLAGCEHCAEWHRLARRVWATNEADRQSSRMTPAKINQRTVYPSSYTAYVPFGDPLYEAANEYGAQSCKLRRFGDGLKTMRQREQSEQYYQWAHEYYDKAKLAAWIAGTRGWITGWTFTSPSARLLQDVSSDVIKRLRAKTALAIA